MHDDNPLWVTCPEIGNLLRREALVNAAEPVPENNPCIVKSTGSSHRRNPHRHAVLFKTHFQARVSPEVLVGEEENSSTPPCSLKGPFQHAARI